MRYRGFNIKVVTNTKRGLFQGLASTHSPDPGGEGLFAAVKVIRGKKRTSARKAVNSVKKAIDSEYGE